MSHRGFTLLEVVVALAILAMGLMAVSDVVGGALRNGMRAHRLDVATLLARGKLASLEDHYEEEGFQVDDETDEGTFEDQGHPEIRWKVEVTAPKIDADGGAACDKLLGSGALSSLLPSGASAATGAGAAGAAAGGASGPVSANPLQASLEGMVKQQCATFATTVKRAMRSLRLTVSWQEGKRADGFTVDTDLVVLQPRKGQP